MRKTFSNIVTGVLVACALVVTVAVVRQAFWTPAPSPSPSREPRAVDGPPGTELADRPRSWTTGPWLSLDPIPRAATGYNLTDFEGVVLDSQGRAHVVDQSSKKVVVFDSELRFSHAAALVPTDRSIRIDMLRQDSVAALDWRTGLVSIRSTETGEVASQFLVSGSGGYYPYAIWRFGQEATGLLAAYTSTYTPDNALQRDRRNFIRLFDRGGGVARDSVFVFPATEKLVAKDKTGISVGPHPFGATSYVRVLAGSIVVQASSREFAVNLVDVEENAATSFSFPTDTTWVSDKELATAASAESAGRAAALTGSGQPSTPLARIWLRWRCPPTLPCTAYGGTAGLASTTRKASTLRRFNLFD